MAAGYRSYILNTYVCKKRTSLVSLQSLSHCSFSELHTVVLNFQNHSYNYRKLKYLATHPCWVTVDLVDDTLIEAYRKNKIGIYIFLEAKQLKYFKMYNVALFPQLLEAIFFIDTVPYSPRRGPFVSRVTLWIQE